MGNSPQINYDQLAQQAGAISPQPAQPDYDALAQQAGAVSMAPQEVLEQQKNYGAQQFGSDLLQGVGESALGFGAGLVELAKQLIKSPWLAKEVARVQGMATRDNSVQAFGKVAGNVGQFAAGNELVRPLMGGSVIGDMAAQGLFQ